MRLTPNNSDHDANDAMKSFDAELFDFYSVNGPFPENFCHVTNFWWSEFSLISDKVAFSSDYFWHMELPAVEFFNQEDIHQRLILGIPHP